jgi:hypothetical protein
MIAEDSNTSLLRSALTAVVGGTWRVVVEPDGGRPAASQPAQAPASAEPDPRDDPDFEPAPAAAAPVDPEAEALKLLQDRLGARPVE